MIKNALISVYNKSKLGLVCKELEEKNINIISTGSTADYILKLGFKCKKISNITKFKEILDGRVKTLHPKIYASLLFDRNKNKHIKEFQKIKFPEINLVIVNLYPFNKSKFRNATYAKCIEMIDIGGPTLLRAAAKNHKSITPICDPSDYSKLIKNLKENNGNTSEHFRLEMAQKIFYTTSKYDQNISNFFNEKNKLSSNNFENTNIIKLKYGENPHQKAYLYSIKNKSDFHNNVLNKKILSFNNIRDSEVAFNCVSEFKQPTAVIIKHTSPCGVATNKNISKAFYDARIADKISAFGGIIAINRDLDAKTAKMIVDDFFEVVLAPAFTKQALKIISKKKNIKLIETKKIIKINKKEIYSINSGFLVQEKNIININKKNIKLVSNYKATKKMIDDLIFAFKVCKYVKSNAIVLAKNLKTISIGGGQTSRIDATKNALKKIMLKNKNFVAASDAFFPFTDSIKILIKKNCTGIIQPSGSINDKKIILYANNKKIPLYFTSYRFFKH